MFIQQNQKISFQPHFGIFSFFLLDSQLHDYLLFSLFSSINNYSSKEEWEKILFPGIFFFGEEKKWKWNEGKSLLIIIRVNFSLIISVRYKNNNLSKDFNLNYSRSIIIPFFTFKFSAWNCQFLRKRISNFIFFHNFPFEVNSTDKGPLLR